MTERIAPFSLTRAVRVGARDGKPGWYRHEYHRRSRRVVWRFRDYRLTDLKGACPRGHPEVKRGPYGKVILAVSQVWVEKDTDDLWVIVALRPRTDGKQEVHLRPYGSWIVTRVVLDITLRSGMLVWNEAVFRNQQRVHMLAATFTVKEIIGFGIDPFTGNRVSD